MKATTSRRVLRPIPCAPRRKVAFRLSLEMRFVLLCLDAAFHGYAGICVSVRHAQVCAPLEPQQLNKRLSAITQDRSAYS